MRVKKFLAGFLSAMMVVSMLPTTAFAAGTSIPENEPANESVVPEHEHDFETNEPVLSDDGTKLIYTCAVEGCEETYEEDYVPDTPVMVNDGDQADPGDGSGGAGTENYVAKIGEGDSAEPYATLADAIKEAAGNDTIILTADATVDASVTIDKAITLDLNGYTLSYTGETALFSIESAGCLTVKDSTANGDAKVGTGKISASVKENGAAIEVSGAFVLESGLIEIPTRSYAIYACDGGSATINGGKIKSYYAPLSGNNTTGDMSFTVTGGELTAEYGPAIYMPGQVGLTITGGTLNGGISLRMGQINISGGTINAITSNIDSPAEYYNYSGNAWLPDALYVFGGTYTSGNSAYGNSLKLNITGGTFNCSNEEGSAVAIYDLGKVEQSAKVKISGDAVLSTNANNRGAYQVLSLSDIGVTQTGEYGTNAGNISTTISGGTFTGGTSLEAKYLAPGYILGENGKVQVNTEAYVAAIGDNKYFTLAEAVEDLQEDETLILLKDVCLDSEEGLNILKNAMLDLNGYSLSIDPGDENAPNPVITIGESVDVTIKNGTIMSDVGQAIVNSGELTLEAVNVSGGDCGIKVHSGIVKVDSSSVITSDYHAIHISNSAKNVTVNIYGTVKAEGTGDLEDEQAAVISSGKATINVYEGATLTCDDRVIYSDNGTLNLNIYGGSISGSVATEVTKEVTSKFAISGGNFDGEIKIPTEAGKFITGGVFNTNISAYVAEGHTQNENGAVTSKSAIKLSYNNEEDTYYSSVKAALDVLKTGTATEATITLMENVVEDITIPTGMSITLDLNGKRLTNASGHTITNNGTLTITDTSGETVGTVDNVTHAKAAIYNAEGASCTILAGQFTRSKENGQNGDDNGGNSFYTINNYGTMTFGTTDGDNNITVTANGHYSSLVHNGWQNSGDAQDKKAIMTINGGTFTGGINTIKNDESGHLTIDGGTFNNVTQYAVQNWNVATIKDGIFESSTMGAVFNGAEADTSVGDLTITGGTFKAPANYYVVYNKNDNGAATKITGGTYSSQYYTNNNSVLNYTTDGNKNGTYNVVMCDENNSAASITEGGKITYYPTLQNAIIAGQVSGSTVVLLADIELGSVATVSDNVTLDLNGHSITRGSGNTSGALILVSDGGNLTIKDGSDEQKGNIYSSNYINTNDNKEYGGIGIQTNKGSVDIQSGTVSGFYGVYNSGGNINVNGGTVEGTDTGIATRGGSIIVNSGMVVGTESSGSGISLFNLNYDNGSDPAYCTINGGTIRGSVYGISCNNLYSGGTPGCQLSISGGTVSSDFCAIYWPNNGKITIGTQNDTTEGPTITGKDQGILICCGEMAVNSGTISCTSTAENKPTCDATNSQTDNNFLWAFRAYSGACGMGDAITVVQNRAGSYAASPVKVTINGATISGSDNNYALRVLDCNQATYAETLTQETAVSLAGGNFTGSLDLNYAVDSKVISGGTFSSKVSDEYCVVGFIPTDDGEGGYTVKEGSYVASVTDIDGNIEKYVSFAAAYAAAEDGATLTVLKAETDWSETYNDTKNGFKVTKNIVIDLNGNTLGLNYSDSDKSGGFYLDLTSNKTLTIKDSKESGKLTTENTNYLVYLSGGKLCLESGTLEAEKATRTVYLKSGSPTFIMNGGTVTNGVAYNTASTNPNQNAIEIVSGNVTINNGLIQTTNETAPACGVKVNNGCILTVNGGTFDTGITSAICNYGNGSIVIYNAEFKSTETSIYAYGAGTVTIGKDGASAVSIPKLLLSRSGIVDIKDNVTIKELEAVSYSDIPEYTFKAANNFGGKYGNDFSEHILGNALACEQIANESYYKVIQVTENDERVVAVITHSDGTTTWFGEAGAAFTALKNGDKLTLKKDITNQGTSSYASAASNIVIDLAGHNITAEKADAAVYFNGTRTGVQENDTIKIIGAGKLQGNKYAITVAGSSDAVFTLTVDASVTLDTVMENGTKVNLSTTAPMARLLMEGAVVNSADCTAKFMTTVSDKQYLYSTLQTAINDTTSNQIDLTGDTKSAQVIAGNVNKVVDIALNNHTLTFTSQFGIISNGVGLNIKNGTILHNFSNKSKYAYTISVGSTDTGTNGSNLVLEDVTVQVTHKLATAVNVNGHLTDVGVTLKNSSIECTAEDTTETVGVYFPVKGGTLNIENTKITAANAVQVKGGTVNIKTGSEITATGAQADPVGEDSGCTNTGDAIYVEDTYGYNPVVKVEGGTIKSTNARALNYFDNDKENATGKIEVSGGNFSNVVPVEYCANGYVPTTATDGNGMYTVTTGPKMYGCTLTLDGTIGVNFYVNMEGVEETARSSYSMKFTVNGSEQKVSFDANACRTFGETQYYRFTCPVAAKQMTDTITAQLVNENGDAVSKEYSYSVRTYYDNMNTTNESLKNLLEAMLHYGAYAQQFFSYNTDNLANKDLNDMAEVSADQLKAYESEISGPLPSDITRIDATLTLESSTMIRYYIHGNIDGYTFRINGEEYTPVQSDGSNADPTANYYIEVPDITVRKLDTMYALTIENSDGNQVYSLTYGALTYAYNKLTAEDTETNLQNTMKAMYLYNEAAKQYTGWLTN